MKSPILRILVISVCTTGLLGGGYFLYRSMDELSTIPEMEESAHLPAAGHGDEHAAADAHGGGHGEAKADAHGGGHGEAKADAHGGGHGEAKADAHGGGHGDGHAPASAPVAAASSLVSLDELFINLSLGDQSHSLGLKLEVELFDEKQRGHFEKLAPGVKHTIIQVSREQNFYRLNTISGKLYFKELIVSRLNDFMKEAVVKEVHFASFFLQ